MKKSTTKRHAPAMTTTTSQQQQQQKQQKQQKQQPGSRGQKYENKAKTMKEIANDAAMASDADADEDGEDISDMEVDEDELELELDEEVPLPIDSEDEAELEAQRISFLDILAAAAAEKKVSKIAGVSSGSDEGDNASVSSSISSNSTVICVNVDKTTTTMTTSTAEESAPLKRKTPVTKETPPATAAENKRTRNVPKRRKRALPPAKRQRKRANSNSSLTSTASSATLPETTTTPTTNIVTHCACIHANDKEDNYIFKCNFCNAQYADLGVLLKHLREIHKLIKEATKRKNARKKNAPEVESALTEIKQEPLVVDTDLLHLCGRLFIVDRRSAQISIHCAQCECKYENFELLDKHLRAQHEVFKRNVAHAPQPPLEKMDVDITEIKKERITIDETVLPISLAMVTIPSSLDLLHLPIHRYRLPVRKTTTPPAAEPNNVQENLQAAKNTTETLLPPIKAAAQKMDICETTTTLQKDSQPLRQEAPPIELLPASKETQKEIHIENNVHIKAAVAAVPVIQQSTNKVVSKTQPSIDTIKLEKTIATPPAVQTPVRVETQTVVPVQPEKIIEKSMPTAMEHNLELPIKKRPTITEKNENGYTLEQLTGLQKKTTSSVADVTKVDVAKVEQPAEEQNTRTPSATVATMHISDDAKNEALSTKEPINSELQRNTSTDETTQKLEETKIEKDIVHVDNENLCAEDKTIRRSVRKATPPIVALKETALTNNLAFNKVVLEPQMTAATDIDEQKNKHARSKTATPVLDDEKLENVEKLQTISKAVETEEKMEVEIPEQQKTLQKNKRERRKTTKTVVEQKLEDVKLEAKAKQSGAVLIEEQQVAAQKTRRSVRKTTPPVTEQKMEIVDSVQQTQKTRSKTPEEKMEVCEIVVVEAANKKKNKRGTNRKGTAAAANLEPSIVADAEIVDVETEIIDAIMAEVEKEQTVVNEIKSQANKRKTITAKTERRKSKDKAVQQKTVNAKVTEQQSVDEKSIRKRSRKSKQMENSSSTEATKNKNDGNTTTTDSGDAAAELTEIKEEKPELEELQKDTTTTAAETETETTATPARRTRKVKSNIDYAVDIKDEDDDDDDDDDEEINNLNDSAKNTTSEYSPSSSNVSPHNGKREPIDIDVLKTASNMLLIRIETAEDGSTRYVCNLCSKSFNKPSRMEDHKRLHTGEKPYVCNTCGRAFRLKMRLNEHMMRHRKEKAFKCEICEMPISTRQDLSLHMRHHKSDRRYKCDVCEKAFVRSSDLAIHVRIHTGEKPYNCEFCGKAFRARQNLTVHRRSHVDDKPIKCELCTKSFSRKIDLRVHMRKHTGEKPYKCNTCERGYSSRVNLQHHMEREHIKEETQQQRVNVQQTKVTDKATNKKPARNKRTNLKAVVEAQEKKIEELTRRLSAQGLNAIPEVEPNEKIETHDDVNNKNIYETTITNAAPAAASAQLLSVTVSMQVEKVSDAAVNAAVDVSAPEKENEHNLSTHTTASPLGKVVSGGKSVQRKVTSYFTVVGQQAEI